jgi:hypothetical protein
LPRRIYAVGINRQDKNTSAYFCNDIFHYCDYLDIYDSIEHVLSIAITFTNHSKLVFLIESQDGYMENNYISDKPRTIPRIIGENEYLGHASQSIKLGDEELEEYAVLDKTKKLYILGQANHKNIPYTFDTIDRNYFYCNLYNSFRSFHQGIPFSSKINKIVYAGRIEHHGSKYNFTKRRDLDMNQREYFYSDAVCKENIVCSSTSWIDSAEMRKYKYILDIDGNSSTWDATAWKLNSNSVIIKTDSRWKQWFYDQYLPWEHYVPISDDFNDLQEKYHWCENHQEECEKIVVNSKRLFQKVYKMSNIIKYIQNIVYTVFTINKG